MRIIHFLLRHWRFVLVFIFGAATALFFVGFTHLSFEMSGTNEFCGRCHEMQRQVDSWAMSSHAVNNKGVVTDCVDCHLPPSGVQHYTYKGWSGFRDVWVHYIGDPTEIDWDEKFQTKDDYLFEDACISCHQDPTPPGLPRGGFLAHRERLNGRTQKKCYDCHERLVHHESPVIYRASK